MDQIARDPNWGRKTTGWKPRNKLTLVTQTKDWNQAIVNVVAAKLRLEQVRLKAMKGI